MDFVLVAVEITKTPSPQWIRLGESLEMVWEYNLEVGEVVSLKTFRVQPVGGTLRTILLVDQNENPFSGPG
jgi:hypothetical protein